MKKKDQDYAREIYDNYGRDYHLSRLDYRKSFFNRFVENPSIEKLTKPIVKNKKVLDLGCGSGILTSKIMKWGGKPVGIDISKTMIELAKKENPKIDFFVMDGSKTSFKERSFDVVTSSLVVHYFKNLKEIFKEVSRITKKEGHFIFSMMHPIRTAGELVDKEKGIIQIEDYRKIKKIELYISLMDGKKRVPMLNYHHPFSDVINHLNDCGFVVERIDEPEAVIEGKKYGIDYFNRLKKCPNFLVVRAKKI